MTAKSSSHKLLEDHSKETVAVYLVRLSRPKLEQEDDASENQQPLKDTSDTFQHTPSTEDPHSSLLALHGKS